MKEGGDDKGTDILRIGLRQVSLVELVENDPLLNRAPLLKALSEGDRLVLLASGQLVQVEPGQDVSGREDLRKGLFFLLEGSINLESQAGVEFETLDKGDIFGLDAVVKQMERFVARSEAGARLAWFPGAMLLRMAAGSPELVRLLQHLAAQRTQRAGEGSEFMDRW